MSQDHDPIHAENLDAPAPASLGKLSIEGDMGVIRIPLSEIHALRVALQPCPCRATKSTSTSELRQRLEVALAKLQSKSGARNS
ncbi:hypothetical protein [Sediminimonas sp.]|uniref:hypothetical protein n=1 Tax=Sediminimonas sp. TaxID=2823379 RepID=UPI0025D0F263|nr:hypothetical protein [Sediminimonas sp.]